MKTIEILKCIRRVMEDVRARDGVIEMESFYRDGEIVGINTTIHNCDTPACVLGWCALDEEFSKMLGLKYFNCIYTPQEA